MKPSDRHPTQWVGLPVFKLEMDHHGHEVQISGKVMSYSPSSARYVLLYMDGSSDGVPVNEIEDHVPLKLQLPVKKRRTKKRQAENLSKETVEHESATAPVKRRKTVQNDPPPTAPAAPTQSDKLATVTRFVQDTLWSMTAALDVSDEKQRVLLATLDNRNEQPFAALARYAEEGGLEAMNETLRACVHETKDKRNEGKENKDCHSEERTSSLPARDEKEKSARRTTARPSASPRTSSRCDQHLRDLMSGKVTGVFSPKSTLPKEPHAPCKEESKADDSQCVRPYTTTASLPVFVDLTNLSEEEEENDDTSGVRRRLHFGRNSTIIFNERDPVDVFQLQVRRTRLQRSKLPQQNPDMWKSSLKTNYRGESETWGIDRLSM